MKKNSPTSTRTQARDAHLDRYPVGWGRGILRALQYRPGTPIVTGFDPEADPARAKRVARWRAQNKVARRSRRINRSRA